MTATVGGWEIVECKNCVHLLKDKDDDDILGLCTLGKSHLVYKSKKTGVCGCNQGEER